MPDDDPIPFYPDLRCHRAPLRPGIAPKVGCGCRICLWATARAEHEAVLNGVTELVRPGTPQWDALLATAL
jgi:hypothetical protein